MLGKCQSPPLASLSGDPGHLARSHHSCSTSPPITGWGVGVLWLLTPAPHNQAPPRSACSQPTPASRIGLHLPYWPASQLSGHRSGPLRPDRSAGSCLWGGGRGIEPSRSAPLSLKQLLACRPLPRTPLEAKCLSAALPPLGTHVRGMDFLWPPPLKECARMPNLLVINAMTVP